MKLRSTAFFIASLTVALHLAFNHRFNYYRDELYFIDCARHLAWGYVDQPPLAPLAAWMTAPLGYAVWAIRFLPAVFSGVTVLFACAIAREFRGSTFAEILTGITVALAPGFLGLGYGLSTEFLSPAAWGALVYFTLLLVRTRNERLYVAIALVVALGMYAKYSIAACAIALGVALATTGKSRLLASRWLGGGVALVVLLLLPNELWQVSHDFPMLGVIHGDQINRHALANGHAWESANLGRNALYFAGTQLLYQNPFLSVIWIWGLVALVRGIEAGKYRFLAVAYFLLVGLIIATVGRGYYLEGFYPALFAAGAVAIERAVRSKPRWVPVVLALAAGAAAAIMVPLALPVFSLSAYKHYEVALGLSYPASSDGKRHLVNPMYADQIGWNEMTRTVAQAYYSLPPTQRAATAVFADRYADAGALDFYGPRYGLPAIISPNNSYYLWGTHGYSGRSVLAVGATDYNLLRQAFGQVRQIAVYRNDDRWILEGPLPIYLCTQPRAPLSQLWPRFKYYGL